MSNISLDEVMVSRRMAEPTSNATAGTLALLCGPDNEFDAITNQANVFTLKTIIQLIAQ